MSICKNTPSFLVGGVCLVSLWTGFVHPACPFQLETGCLWGKDRLLIPVPFSKEQVCGTCPFVVERVSLLFVLVCLFPSLPLNYNRKLLLFLL